MLDFRRMLRFRRNRHDRRSKVSRASRLAPAIERLEDRRLLSGSGGLLGFGSLTVDTASYDSSKILVQLRADACAGNGAAIFSNAEARVAAAGVPGLFEVSLSPGTTVDDALRLYRSHASVLLAEPDYRIQLTTVQTPNDPSFSGLWGLNNTGQTGGTADADIDALGAWSVTTGSRSTVVAVIDTGVDYTHPDLAANMWVNPGEIAGNGLDDDGNGFVDDLYGYDFVDGNGDPLDENGHGTHVAGTIAAVGSNGVGVIGVAPNVRIMALKFLDADGGGYISDAVRALDYAVANGAQVSNNSWGGGGWSQAFSAVIDRARAAGHIFVAAAGNSGSDNDSTASYPASYAQDNVVSVAATDHNDRLASFSNYGATSVDLAAPGVNISSTVPGSRYDSYSGTSMAAPHVSGAVALVRSLHPDWTYRQVIGQVLGTVDTVAGLSGKVATGGRLNAAVAVGAPDDRAGDASRPVGRPALTGPGSTTTDATPQITWTAATAAARYELLVYNVPAGRAVVHEQNLSATSHVSGTAFAVGPTYQAFVRGIGSGGDVGQWSAPLYFTIAPPGAPSLTGPGPATHDTTPEITWTGPAGTHRYELLLYNVAAGRLVARAENLATTSFTPNAPLPARQTYQVFVRAVNDGGTPGAWGSPLLFEVRPPAAPQLTGPATDTGDPTPEITWQAAAGAASYELLLYDLAAGRLVEHGRDLTTTSFAPSTPLTVGRTYQVFVRGINDAGDAGAWSGPREFHVNAETVDATAAGAVFVARSHAPHASRSHAPRGNALVDAPRREPLGTERAERDADPPQTALPRGAWERGQAPDASESRTGSDHGDAPAPAAPAEDDDLLDRLFAELGRDALSASALFDAE